MIHLNAGDCVFIRPYDGEGDPRNDVLQIAVSTTVYVCQDARPSTLLTRIRLGAERNRVLAAQNSLLGEQSGARFEGMQSVHGANRAYHIPELIRSIRPARNTEV